MGETHQLSNLGVGRSGWFAGKITGKSVLCKNYSSLGRNQYKLVEIRGNKHSDDRGNTTQDSVKLSGGCVRKVVNFVFAQELYVIWSIFS